jgi:hypothetical protein
MQDEVNAGVKGAITVLMAEADGHTSGGIPKALSKLRAAVATKLKPPAGLADQVRRHVSDLP